MMELWVVFRRGVVVCAVAFAWCAAQAQVIEFESGGLRYQALTKDGLTIMVASLPPTFGNTRCLQVAVQNGGKSTYVIRPEDFLYRPDEATEIPALPARTVVNSLDRPGQQGRRR